MFILFSKLKNKKVVTILIVLSFIFYFFAYQNNFFIDIDKAFSINQYLIVLLIGVGFLRLIFEPKKEELAKSSQGKSSFFKTYFSLHLFGSIINISAVLLIADKLYIKRNKLSNLQIILLTRAFSSDAYWSPFFVAFGAVITFAPNLEFFYVSSLGLALAFITFVVTYFEVRKKDDFVKFEGYPLNLENLIIPFSLAFFVLLTHYFYEDIKIIVLISFLAFILSFFVPLIKKGIKNTITKQKKHIIEELPNMKSEISLFLAAGIFGVSVSSILNGIGFSLPFEYFDYKIASVVLAIFIFLSMIGVHAIITISVFGHMLGDFNQTLVSITFWT
jgi:hypothetical protein